MNTRDKYSLWALIMIIVGETFSVLALRLKCPYLWIVTILAILVITTIWIVGNRKDDCDFNPKSVVVSKLLANAIAPRKISAFYLLFFVIHIGWLSDGTLNLFLSNAYSHGGEIIISLISGVLGLVFLIIFFPRSSDKKEKETIPVFISGISTPSIPNVPEDKKYNKLNLRPLVRLLQETSDEETENCKLLILLTNSLNEKSTSKLRDVLCFVNDSYVEEFDKCQNVEDRIKLLIKVVAKREFPQKMWLNTIEEKIFFTQSCDYDDFRSCYSILNQAVSEFDNKNHYLHFNLTPGTGNIGSIMTLMAMDPQRALWYYRQNEDIDDDKRMTKIEKEYETIKALCYSTLEKINDLDNKQ